MPLVLKAFLTVVKSRLLFSTQEEGLKSAAWQRNDRNREIFAAREEHIFCIFCRGNRGTENVSGRDF